MEDEKKEGRDRKSQACIPHAFQVHIHYFMLSVTVSRIIIEQNDVQSKKEGGGSLTRTGMCRFCQGEMVRVNDMLTKKATLGKKQRVGIKR